MSSLSADDAAAYLGVSKQTLYAYVSRGLVSSEPTATRERRYPRWSLDELKARRAGRHEPAAAGMLLWGVQPIESALLLVEGDRMYYRGLDAVELARTRTYEEVARLLWDGTMDGAAALFPRRSEGRAPADLDERLFAALVDARAEPAVSLNAPSEATLRAAGALVGRLFEAAGARGDGPLAHRLARGWNADPELLSAALVLCAEHGLNASSFTARVVAATDAPLVNALLGALSALEGRRHGGVGRLAIRFLADVDRLGAERACAEALAAQGWAPGFWSGNALHPTGDPRAAELLRLLDLPADDPVLEATEHLARLGGVPTVDYALAALELRRGLPEDAAFALFALGRSAGWIAHALESAATGQLIRPHARYVGPAPQMSSSTAARARMRDLDAPGR
ncbi:MAG TPA: citrate synthase [Gaiellaceae bacterium]|nr:citrate synthase [Gaiellaceae bacterium]